MNSRILFRPFAVLCIAALCNLPALAQGPSKPGPPAKDAAGPARGTAEVAPETKPVRDPFVAPKTEAAFIQAAVKGCRAEVKLAQLALTKTKEEKVKEFAQSVVGGHTHANGDLKTVAEGLGIPLETADPAAKLKYDDLEKKSGKEFDEAFLEEMAGCHARDLALFEAGKKVSTSPDVNAIIDRTLPLIQQRAEKINLMGAGAHRSDGGTSPPPKASGPPPTPGIKPVSLSSPTGLRLRTSR